MAKAYPAEFRRDGVSVARKHEAPLSQIAKDFGFFKIVNILAIEREIGCAPCITAPTNCIA